MKKEISIVFLILIIAMFFSGCSIQQEKYISQKKTVASVFDKLSNTSKIIAPEPNKSENPTTTTTVSSSVKPEIISTTVADTNSINRKVKVKEDVFFRDLPDMEKSKIIQTLPIGTELILIEQNVGTNKDFAKVKLDETIGYVFEEYIQELP